MPSRLRGLDLARFLAIAGMVVAHTVPEEQQGPVAGFLVNGNASTLFAVASGVSLVLASRRYLAVGAAGRARLSIVVRGCCLVVLGVLLGTLPQQAVIVLVYLGVALILAAPLLTAPRWVLAATAAVLAIAVPPANVLARQALGVPSEGYSLGIPDLADPLRMLRAVLLTGTYPALTWLVYVLLGMLIGRALLRTAAPSRRRVALRLSVAGVLTAVAALGIAALAVLLGAPAATTPDYGAPTPPALDGLLSIEPHSGTLPDILRGAGVATAVLGLCLLLCWSAPAAVRALRPAIAAGAAPLSSYVLHILTLAVVAGLAGPAAPPPWWQFGWGAAALNILLVLALGAVLALLRRRGPFEAVVSRLADRMPRAPEPTPTVWQ